MISKKLQILGLQPRILKVLSQSLEQFFLAVGQNNFGNKIPLLTINIVSGFFSRHTWYMSEILTKLSKTLFMHLYWIAWKQAVYLLCLQLKQLLRKVWCFDGLENWLCCKFTTDLKELLSEGWCFGFENWLYFEIAQLNS